RSGPVSSHQRVDGTVETSGPQLGGGLLAAGANPLVIPLEQARQLMSHTLRAAERPPRRRSLAQSERLPCVEADPPQDEEPLEEPAGTGVRRGDIPTWAVGVRRINRETAGFRSMPVRVSLGAEIVCVCLAPMVANELRGHRLHEDTFVAGR